MAIVSLDCPNCGAKLPPREDTGRTRCEYCGATFETARAAQHPNHAQLPNPNLAAPAPSARGALALSIGLTVAMAGIGFVLFLASAPSTSVGPPVGGEQTVSSVVMGSANAAQFGWDDNGGPPTVVTLDGKEHVLGRIRDRTGGGDQLHIAAFDSDTGAERYRVGPLGSYSDGYRATHFAVAGGRLVITDFRSNLKIHDLATGAVQKEIALTDRADKLCLTQESGEAPQLYLAQVDRREFLVDPSAGALKDASLPKDCDDLDFGREGDPRARRRDRLRSAPKVDGFEAEAVHLAGELAVARGVKSPGTAYPMAVGFDPKTHAVRWKSPVAAVDLASVRERDNAQDALVAGRYIATYGEGQEFWHLTAFDAQTGARLWDHKLRSVFAVDWLQGLAASDKNIYLVRMSSLEVHDAATGALKSTIGAESYDG